MPSASLITFIETGNTGTTQQSIQNILTDLILAGYSYRVLL